MSILVVQIAPRARLRASTLVSAGPEPATATDDYVYALTPDGLLLDNQGQCAPALLPRADTVVAVLADADVSWHRVNLPKAPASRLRTALAGLLEEAVLDDVELTHFAVAPQASAGAPTWIAAIDKAWLRAELRALEKAGVFVDRVVPSAWPDDPPCGHFAETDGHEPERPQGITLTWSHPDGVACLRLHGGLARAVVPNPPPPGTRWSATPGAAAAAEQWLGMPVNVMQPAQRLLQASRTLWNLRQFDLARRNRGTRALRDAWKQWRGRAWKPVRYGVVALVVAQIAGLNLWAWRQHAAIAARQESAFALVKSTFPRVSDNDIRRSALLVMQREADAVRQQAGKPGETDFEPMLQAAAAAWPPDMPPADSLRFEPGRLTLVSGGWRQPQFEQFRSRLRPGGWQAEQGSEGRVMVTRLNLGVTP